MNKTLRIGLLVVVGVAALGVGVYFLAQPNDAPRVSLPAPAQSIQAVLEMRAESSTDTTRYARYVESTEVASSLAQAAVGANGRPLIPDWSAPTVVSSDEASANVLVEWKASEEFPDWPAATTFVLKKLAGRWKIVDAFESTSTAPPSGAQDETKTP